MSDQDLKPTRRLFLLVMPVTAIICLTVLFIFRTNIFISALKKGIHILEPFLFGGVTAWLLHPICVRI